MKKLLINSLESSKDFFNQSNRKNDLIHILKWYQMNQRSLPWRANNDPYRVWISEVMLQQTTIASVIPYYERFMNRFPSLDSLANSDEIHVLESWAGLGYYSRARNLHRAAKILNSMQSFPRTYLELLELPGFGPYTARAVSSIAFNEPAGVVDGNVTRVLSRWSGKSIEWWTPKGRDQFQLWMDHMIQHFLLKLRKEPAYQVRYFNQGIMELGATICTPSSPQCFLCPLSKSCQAFARTEQSIIPRPKPRKQITNWVWNAEIHIREKKVLLVKNESSPVLKNQLLFPGDFSSVKNKPKLFQYHHTITHHRIYVNINQVHHCPSHKGNWIPIQDLKKVNPSSLLQKALKKLSL